MELGDTYIRYGVSEENAKIFASMSLSASAFKTTKKSRLIDMGLDSQVVDSVKTLLRRVPIDKEVAHRLLHRSRYTCCACRGSKGIGYVIHHISLYSKTQDNSYENLIVLCLDCHSLAHGASGLASTITEYQLIKSKERWESQVAKQDTETAVQTGDIGSKDYVNIIRIRELAQELSLPIGQHPPSPMVSHGGPLYFDIWSSIRIYEFYSDVFNQLLNKVKFENIDGLLKKTIVNQPGFIGKFCFYSGGVYGKQPDRPITEATPPVRLYFRRKPFLVEWSLDPRFFCTTTGLDRAGGHNLHQIYGRIRNVDVVEVDNSQFTRISVQPFLVGMPNRTFYRTPIVRLIKDSEYDLIELLEEDSSIFEC